ncbi:hypothetical protein, partial [Borreliella bavariensis]|uniref:hypothetical protein n=1 Tax=Borreliella bavariensis TaxID=664662 RepID=UPI001CB73D4B
TRGWCYFGSVIKSVAFDGRYGVVSALKVILRGINGCCFFFFLYKAIAFLNLKPYTKQLSYI